jgi:hypothetical protein
MRLRKMVAGAATAALLLAANPVAAAVMIATYDGTVASGTDNIGYFTTPGGDLSGLTYRASFTYDTAVGSRTTDAFMDSIQGGTFWGAPTPILSASITIGTATASFGSNGRGSAAYFLSGPPYQIAHETEFDSGTDYEFLAFAPFVADQPPNTLEQAFSSTGAGCFLLCGSFSARHGAIGFDYTGTLNVASVEIAPVGSVVGAIPEPATWATIILGAGGTGAMLRRRRRQALGQAALT